MNFSGISNKNCDFDFSNIVNKREFAVIGKEDCYFASSSNISSVNFLSNINTTFYEFKYCSNITVVANSNANHQNITSCFAYNKEYCEKFKELSDKGFYYYNYSNPNDPDNFICLNENSTMYKMLKLKKIEGFEKVYSDENSVIYKMTK